ncbi:MAG: hypothetical protein ACFE7R_07180, partial [Candidatus Hodarchaeota archaeon]
LSTRDSWKNDGEVAWELQIPGENETFYWSHRLERFYIQPLIAIQDQDVNLNTDNLWLNLTTWNIFKQDAASEGILRVLVDGTEIYQDSFDFLPYWQPNTLEISTALPARVTYIEVQVENSDGIVGTILVYGAEPVDFNLASLILPILGGVAVAIPIIIIVLIKTGRLQVQRSEI